MEDDQETSRISLKIVLVLSLLLVGMDIFEIYFSYTSLKEASYKYDSEIFESCLKYHYLSQMFFTLFATLAGISACIMSIGLLISYTFFAIKVMDTFLYFNYYVFGPSLFAACLIGYYNFNHVAFNCDPDDITKKYINFSTVLAMAICLLLSFLVSVGYSAFWSMNVWINSVKFNRDGIKILGKIFWKYVFSRNSQENIRIGREMNNLNRGEI